MYRLIKASVLLAVVGMALVANSFAAEKETVIDEWGREALAGTDAVDLSDLDFATICFPETGLYFRLTPEKSQKLIRDLHDGLIWMQPAAYPFPVWPWGRIVLHARSGKVSSIPFTFDGHRNGGQPQTIRITWMFTAARLASFFAELWKNLPAATCDAGLPAYEVKTVAMCVPHETSIEVSALDESMQPLIDKAKAILERLDVRSLEVEPVTDMNKAMTKFGSFAIVLSKPVSVGIYLHREEELGQDRYSKGEPWITDILKHDLDYRTIQCQSVYIQDYGNCPTPSVVLKDTSGQFFLYPELTRRRAEAWAIQEHGFPGHPTTDTDYYESAEALYGELQELTKAAYKK